MSRRVLINLGVFLAISLLFIQWAASNILHVSALEHPSAVTADFSAAFGVLHNAEVTYLGTQVGTVSGVRRIPGGVRITMQLNHGTTIPVASTARIARKSAIGEPFINFTPDPATTGGPPFLKAGDGVPITRTAVPIEFSELLRSASRLVQSIPADDLHTVIHELATGVAGRGPDLRSLIESSDKLAGTLAARADVLDRLAAENTRLTRVVAAHSGSLEAILSDLRQVSASLKAVHGDLGPLLERGNALLADLNPLVADHQGDLTCVLTTVRKAVDATSRPDRLTGLATTLSGLPVAFDHVFDATDLEQADTGGVRRWVRVGFLENVTNPAPMYVPAKSTPPPGAGGVACPALATVAGPGRTAAGAPLRTPSTGGGFPLGAAVGLLVVAGCSRRLRALAA